GGLRKTAQRFPASRRLASPFSRSRDVREHMQSPQPWEVPLMTSAQFSGRGKADVAVAPAPERTEGDLGIGRDDYAVTRMPPGERKHWFVVFLQRYGQLSALSQFLLGATLGFGMDFWQAFLALTLGAVILEVVAVFTGIAGQ